MSLHSPLPNPADWQLAVIPGRVPDGFRYSGYPVRVLAAQRPAGQATIVAPFSAAARVRSVGAAGGAPATEVVELQPLAARFGRLARALPAGLPTLYCLFPTGTAVSPVDQRVVAFGESLAAAASVRLVMAYPDRLPREPAVWAEHWLQTIVTVGEDASMWQPFASEIAGQTSGPSAPVLLLDHAGTPLTSGSLEIDVAGATRPITLQEADGGDLQAAIARLHAADAAAMPLTDLWGAASEAVLRPTDAGSATGVVGDVQLARLEDGHMAQSQIVVTPAARHVLITDLYDWFAPQTALVGAPAAPRLQRLTRGNLVAPLVNGPAFFTDLFARLDEAAASAVGGLHLSGWTLYPETPLADPQGAPASFPRKLEDAAAAIGAAGGRCCYLPAGFIQVQDPAALQNREALILLIAVAANLVSAVSQAPPRLRDGTGMLLGFAVLVANAAVATYLLGRDLQDLEPNHDAVETLNDIAGNRAVLSYYPLTADDNPRADLGGIALGAGTLLFEHIRHFNVYHQKLAIVRRDAGFVGYCGGIDLNPDRLDDHRHLAATPYHDTQLRVEGPAVRDLVTTFDERWQRDGQGPPAFGPADVEGVPAAGAHIVQIARTYGRALNTARALPFAPQGDRTILDTYRRAITQAREFIYLEDQYLTPPDELVNALLARLSGPDPIRRLILLIPDITDQPFGETRRTEVIAALRGAGAALGPDVVRIGSPRRRVTVPQAELRASSGRLLLKEFISSSVAGATAVALGPVARLPDVPFWISIDGELMWIYNEAPLLPNRDPNGMRIFLAERGDATRITSGVGAGRGSTPRDHDAGAAATIVHMDGIYVHAKAMIVDDVFLCIGSANLNRRGFYSDGECNAFVVPERLRSGPDNPVRAVRKQLWAEALNLPHELADPLLEDPIAASALFDRSYFLGNRFVEAEAFPVHVVRDFGGGDGLVSNIVNLLAGSILVPQSYRPFFDTVVDPSSALEP